MRFWRSFLGGGSQGLRLAAAAYLKNFIRRNTDDNLPLPERQKFRDMLAQVLLQADPSILKVLVEAVCNSSLFRPTCTHMQADYFFILSII